MTVIALSHGSREGRTAARDLFAALRTRAENLDARGLLQLAIREAFPQKIAVISSFAAETVVLLHHVAQIDPTTPVLFLNTHKLFGETMRLV